MTLCPYCKRPLKGDLAVPHLSKRQRIVYNAVVESSGEGARRDDLLKAIGSVGPGGPIVLRVQVHEINKKIAAIKQRIKGSGGSYWLINTGE